MKKEKIYSIIIASISLLLFFMPTARTDSYWLSILQDVTISIRQHDLNDPFYLFELILLIIGILTIAMSIVNVIINKRIFQILSTTASSINAILWVVLLFAEFKMNGGPRHTAIYRLFTLSGGARIIWFILYLIMLLGITVLIVLPYIHFTRRPTKTDLIEQRVAELEQQVDELKKGE